MPGKNALRYLFEDCVLDTDRRELRRGADLLSITPQVFDVLAYLIRNRERVVSKNDLIAAVWGGRIVSDAAVTTRINVVRSAIGDSGEDQRLIKTLPRKGFRFVGAVREVPGLGPVPGDETPVEPPRPALTLPDKPSIAVLAFTNLSGDPQQDYLADGIVDDIIIELARFSELFVIARNSSFQYKGRAVDVRQVGRQLGVHYVLEGSVRQGGDRVRVSAQLIDAATGAHRWAEHYDRKIEDVFAVQDEVVRTIVTILAAHVKKAEIERTHAKSPNSWKAYDYYLQASDCFTAFNTSFSSKDLYETRGLVQQSLTLDGSYARSYALLAQTYEAAWVNPVDSDIPSPGARTDAQRFARKAVQNEPNLRDAHTTLAAVRTWKRQHEGSLGEIERTFALYPIYLTLRYGMSR